MLGLAPFFVAAALLPLALAAARADPVRHGPDYDMPNGDGVASGGTWNYWDAIYTGAGDRMQDGAPLSGGFGKLTDGVVADAPWDAVSDVAGLGPHVGWRLGATSNPTITFRLLPPTCLCVLILDRMTIWLDNTRTGGVGAPLGILVNGVAQGFAPPPPGSLGPVEMAFHIRVFDNAYTVQFLQDPSHPWTMVSEIDASGRSFLVPAPASLLLLGTALSGLGLLERGARWRTSRPRNRCG